MIEMEFYTYNLYSIFSHNPFYYKCVHFEKKDFNILEEKNID